MSGLQKIVILCALGVAFVLGGYYSPTLFEKDTESPTACTLEAKICPDGSAVGRVGPNCEFAACPGSETEDSEKQINPPSPKPDAGLENTNVDPVATFPKPVLDLSNRGLTEVPMSTFSQTNLRTLDLSGNRLVSVQAEVRHLSELRVLDLSDNILTNVPAELGQLSKLEILDLSGNKLTGLPYELGNLKNLKTLDLRGNAYATADLAIIKQGLPSSANILVD